MSKGRTGWWQAIEYKYFKSRRQALTAYVDDAGGPFGGVIDHEGEPKDHVPSVPRMESSATRYADESLILCVSHHQVSCLSCKSRRGLTAELDGVCIQVRPLKTAVQGQVLAGVELVGD